MINDNAVVNRRDIEREKRYQYRMICRLLLVHGAIMSSIAGIAYNN